MNLRLFVPLALCFATGAEARQEQEQQKQSPWFVRVAYQPGWIVSTTEFLEGQNAVGESIDRVQAFKIELGWQTDGSDDWEQRYNFPAMGVGVYKGSFRNGEELGSPAAVYGWFSWPLFGLGERFDVATDFGFGAAFNWNPFDPVSNPLNDAVSTSATFYGKWGIFARYAVSRKIDLMAGGTFTHFSNGGTGDPNAAVNTLSPLVSLRYNFRATRPKRTRRELPPIQRFWQLSLFGGGGWKNVNLAIEDDPVERQDFGVADISFEIQRRFYNLGKLAVGLDWTYDGSANASADTTEPVSSSAKLALGAYGGYAQVIHRFSIPIQIGYYVSRGREDDRVPAFYQKLGWKFHVSDRFFVGMQARFFDFSRADFVTWIVGFDLVRFASRQK